jgi:hypothetical protein
MADAELQLKLSPARFPNMSPQMAAMLGFLFGRAYTTPALADVVVTPDGHVLGRPEGDTGPLAYLAAAADLRANLRRLGMAAGLSADEWAELDTLVRSQLGVGLEE